MNIIEYENYHEQLPRESSGFPYLTYPCSIPGDFTQVPLHWHEEMELVYVKKGCGTVSVDFMPCKVRAGDIIFICPGQFHDIRQLRQESMEYENIIFPLHLLNASHADSVWETYLAPIARRQAALPLQLCPDAPEYPPIANCLDQIDDLRRTFPPAYELLIKGKLFELFFQLYDQKLVQASPEGNTKQKTLDKTRRILKYVEQHYAEPLSIEKMAQASGLSQSHFMKFFKQTFGTTFTAYLNDYRLAMASRLLLASEDTILTVAAECGFENLSYFNRVFKRKFGMTPREFRGEGARPS